MITLEFRFKDHPNEREKKDYEAFLSHLKQLEEQRIGLFLANEGFTSFYIQLPDVYQEIADSLEFKLQRIRLEYDCSSPYYNGDILEKKYRNNTLHQRYVQTAYNEPCVTVHALEKMIRESKSDAEIVKALKACIQEDIAFDSL